MKNIVIILIIIFLHNCGDSLPPYEDYKGTTATSGGGNVISTTLGNTININKGQTHTLTVTDAPTGWQGASFSPAVVTIQSNHSLYGVEVGTTQINIYNASSVYIGAITVNVTSGSSLIDTTAPTNGTLSATAGNSQVSLSWSNFSDSGGIASYKLVYSTVSSPSSCSTGTQIYSGTNTSYTHTGLTNGTTYYYRVCATDNAGNTSSGAIASAIPQSSTTTTSNPSLGTWKITSSLNGARRFLAGIVYNGYVYAIGGINGASTQLSSVEYAPINADGSLVVWQYTSSMNTARGCIPGTFVYNNYIYVLGGGDCGGNDHNTIEYTPINSNGTIGTWQYTANLPFTGTPSAVAYNGYVYIVGGYYNNNHQNRVFFAPINSNGTIGTWTETSSMNLQRTPSSFVYNGYIYASGGAYSGGTNTNAVEYARINTDGSLGAWQYTSSMNVATRGHITFVCNGYAYRLSGHDSNSPSGVYSSTEYAKINSNGTLGSWTLSTNMNTGRYGGGGGVYNGYAYVFGGWHGNAGDSYSGLSSAEYASIGP